MGVQQLLSDELNSPIDNCDICRVGNEEMLPTDPNRTESKSYDNNCDSNCDNDRVGGKERESNNIEGPE